MITTETIPWDLIRARHARLQQCWFPERVTEPVFTVHAPIELAPETDDLIRDRTGLDPTNEDPIEAHALRLVRRAFCYARASEFGFTNPFLLSPVNYVDTPHGCHFYPLLFGCKFKYTSPSPDSFTTWPIPMIRDTKEASRFGVPRLDSNPVVEAYVRGVADIRRLFDPAIPFEPPYFSLTDTAAALWNPMELLTALREDPHCVGHLLDVIVCTYIEFYRRVTEAAGTVFGRPYSNDLLDEFVSPETYFDVLFPRYRAVAEVVGGLNVAYIGRDRAALRSFWQRYSGAAEGCAHRDIPFEDVGAALAGKAAYALADYPHDESYQGPTFAAGAYWNPITWQPTERAPEARAALAGKVNMHFTICRRTLDEAVARRDEILG